MADETVKQENKPLTLIVENQHAHKVHFKAKLDTKFEKIFAAYEQATRHYGYRFHFDGNRIGPQQTPAELEMEDGDRIDAFADQIGAGCWLKE